MVNLGIESERANKVKKGKNNEKENRGPKRGKERQQDRNQFTKAYCALAIHLRYRRPPIFSKNARAVNLERAITELGRPDFGASALKLTES